MFSVLECHYCWLESRRVKWAGRPVRARALALPCGAWAPRSQHDTWQGLAWLCTRPTICVLEKADRLAFWLSVSLTPCSLKSARFPPPSLRSASRLSSA
ncbi:hypothetical protein MRB53_000403 [Persea americana]|uniref:Uncharacterized protein n=1 Tax=Persea americana TaxID=3435 RepID=A0ACC2MNS9_PERAE|nr:hypothetical protein MRB53_000403 [Persea americana]